MNTDLDYDVPEEPEPNDDDSWSQHAAGVRGPAFDGTPDTTGALLGPVNWNLLTAAEAQIAWADLDAWVTWLRTTYGLPPAVIPPFWHRHDELVWELSALHIQWLNAYDPDNSPAAPLVWHREFAEARERLREWVSTCGTRIDADRPTRQTIWPGEQPPPPPPEVNLTDRAADFEAFVAEDLAVRQSIEGHVTSWPT